MRSPSSSLHRRAVTWSTDLRQRHEDMEAPTLNSSGGRTVRRVQPSDIVNYDLSTDKLTDQGPPGPPVRTRRPEVCDRLLEEQIQLQIKLSKRLQAAGLRREGARLRDEDLPPRGNLRNGADLGARRSEPRSTRPSGHVRRPRPISPRILSRSGMPLLGWEIVGRR